MKYKITTDKDKFVKSISHTGTSEDIFELNLNKLNLNYLGCYKVVKNGLVFDMDKYDEVKKAEEDEKKKPSELEKLEAQCLYTAMMTDTLLGGE